MNSVSNFIAAMSTHRNWQPGSTWIEQARLAAAAGWTDETHQQHERWREELLNFINSTPDSSSNTLDINIVALMEKMRTMRGWLYSTTASRLKNTLGAVADLHNRPYSNTRIIKGYIRWLTKRDASQPRRKAPPMQFEDLARATPATRGPLEVAFLICARMGNATGAWMSGFDAATSTLRFRWGEHKMMHNVRDLEHETPIPPQFAAAQQWLRRRWERVRHKQHAVGRIVDNATVKQMCKELKRLGLTNHSVRRGGAQYRHRVMRRSACSRFTRQTRCCTFTWTCSCTLSDRAVDHLPRPVPRTRSTTEPW